MTLEDAIDQAKASAQMLTSFAADFDKGHWTFFWDQPFRCGAGEYMVIPHAAWQAFLSNVRAVSGANE